MADDAEQLLLLQREQLARDRVEAARSETEHECYSMIASACPKLRAKGEALTSRNRAALERLVLDMAIHNGA